MRIVNLILLLSQLTVFVTRSGLAANPVPPPVVSVCEFSDEWIGKFIEVDGVLTHFKIPSDAGPGTPDLKLTSDACTTIKSVLVTLSYCGPCDCWETQSQEIWTMTKSLRAFNVESAKIKARGELEKTDQGDFRYLFRVSCIQRITAP